MLKLIPKVLLLVALLATLVVSNVPVFAGPLDAPVSRATE
jgi:hypothetical protein